AKQAAEAIAEQERFAKQQAEQKAQRLAERLRSLGINPDEM
ncbi:MAG: Uma2 family endonuclease, partial [Microcystis panniformis]